MITLLSWNVNQRALWDDIAADRSTSPSYRKRDHRARRARLKSYPTPLNLG
jgi:hypothetical protein